MQRTRSPSSRHAFSGTRMSEDSTIRSTRYAVSGGYARVLQVHTSAAWAVTHSPGSETTDDHAKSPTGSVSGFEDGDGPFVPSPCASGRTSPPPGLAPLPLSWQCTVCHEQGNADDGDRRRPIRRGDEKAPGGPIAGSSRRHEDYWRNQAHSADGSGNSDRPPASREGRGQPVSRESARDEVIRVFDHTALSSNVAPCGPTFVDLVFRCMLGVVLAVVQFGSRRAAALNCVEIPFRRSAVEIDGTPAHMGLGDVRGVQHVAFQHVRRAFAPSVPRTTSSKTLTAGAFAIGQIPYFMDANTLVGILDVAAHALGARSGAVRDAVVAARPHIDGNRRRGLWFVAVATAKARDAILRVHRRLAMGLEGAFVATDDSSSADLGAWLQQRDDFLQTVLADRPELRKVVHHNFRKGLGAVTVEALGDHEDLL